MMVVNEYLGSNNINGIFPLVNVKAFPVSLYCI